MKARVTNSISQALGRSLEIGSVRLRFLPRPGFEIDDLLVRDGSGFGAEPLLRAPDVTAAVSLSALFRGRMEIARLSLSEPSLNLTRNQNYFGLPLDTDPATATFEMWVAKRNTEGGGRLDNYLSDSIRQVMGVKGEINDAWTYDAYGQFGITDFSDNEGNFLGDPQIANNRGLKWITISIDEPRNSGRVYEMLSGKRASAANYIFTGDKLRDLAVALDSADPKWDGSPPHTLLIAPGGKVVYRHVGPIDRNELSVKIREHLKDH